MNKDYGQDKVKKICDVIKKETLEPAQEQAKKIVDHAQDQAKQIVESARKESEKMREEARKEIESERNVFTASLSLACKQTLSSLKQQIEGQLFNGELFNILSSETRDPKIIAKIISVITEAIAKEGLEANLMAEIAKEVNPREVSALLANHVINRLKGGEVAIGDLKGGARVKVEGRYITIDMSETALKELIANFVREDFRKLIFSS